MPWKNGGGSTMEIATGPREASLDGFDWRASIATIERNGPFSSFPGIDRALVLLAGAGMKLTVDGDAVVLASPHAMIRFRGEAEVTCSLRAGPTRDFNFMWRRATTRARVATYTTGCDLPPARAIVCHATTGTWNCELGDGGPFALHADHTLVADAHDAARGGRLSPGTPQAGVIVAVVDEVRA